MIEREIKMFILKALLAAGGDPMTDESLRNAVIYGFPHIKFADSKLTYYIESCEKAEWIAKIEDAMFGTMWSLTRRGKFQAGS